MAIRNRLESIFLLCGDIIVFALSLWLALIVRYLEVPAKDLFIDHLVPFTFIFALSIAIFYIAGLYGKHTMLFKSRLPSIIFYAQVISALVAALFFYLVPHFGITPKTNLFIYLVISFGLMFLWRLYGVSLFGFRKREKAILIGSGHEMRELLEEVNNNSRYNLTFVSSLDLEEVDQIDFNEELLGTIYSEEITSIVIDIRNKKVESILPKLYNLIFSKVQFIDKYKVYEDIFDRVPLSVLTYTWFLENISLRTHIVYDLLKRAMDLAISIMLGLISLPFYPLVWIAIKIDDGGPMLFTQERIGKHNKVMNIFKFRSMTTTEPREVTRVGAFLRATRIDELPQILNVLRGDLSLVGPRPEIPQLARSYEKEIPYYSIRHLIKPGLSGWAQIHQENPPKFDLAYDGTKLKLSYDLYYIKNRSLLLDLKIALHTIRTLLSRSGR